MNFGDIAQKAQQMQSEMQNIQVEGQSGAGLVKVKLNGRYECEGLEIDASLLANTPEAKEILEDLIMAAFNNANGKIAEGLKEKMQALTGGLKMPPGFKMPF